MPKGRGRIVERDAVTDSRGSAAMDAADLRRVARYLALHSMSLEEERGSALLSGGLSNLNYLIRVDGGDVVLRRPPAGPLPKGAHDMVREHTLLSRLSPVFRRAPASLHLCDDMTVIGVPFQLLEYRTGTVVQGDRLPAGLAEPSARRGLGMALVGTLAELHAVDAAAIGLGDFGRPGGFFERTVNGWMRRGADVAPAGSAIGALGDWLLARAPREMAPVILHSDFKLDNCMLDARWRVATVLDWDMGTRGHPLMDLATLTSYWTEAGDPGCMHRLAQMPTAQPGFPTRAEAVAEYARLSGRDVSDFPVWRVLALLKLGVVFLQLHRNWLSGAIGNERYAGFAALGADILDYAYQQARG